MTYKKLVHCTYHKQSTNPNTQKVFIHDLSRIISPKFKTWYKLILETSSHTNFPSVSPTNTKPFCTRSNMYDFQPMNLRGFCLGQINSLVRTGSQSLIAHKKSRTKYKKN